MPASSMDAPPSDFEEVKQLLRDLDQRMARIEARARIDRWLRGLLVGSVVAGIGAGTWWAASINARLALLESGTSKRFADSVRFSDQRFRQLNNQSIDRTREVNERFDQLEATITEVVDRPRVKP